MSEVAQVFEEWFDEVSRHDAVEHLPDEVQVNIRVNDMVAAGLEAVARELHSTRTAVARTIVEAGIHEAMKAGGLVFCRGDDGWTVVERSTDCPEGYRRIEPK
jgi:hypothetical protein